LYTDNAGVTKMFPKGPIDLLHPYCTSDKQQAYRKGNASSIKRGTTLGLFRNAVKVKKLVALEQKAQKFPGISAHLMMT
jgi:hypothetical protein